MKTESIILLKSNINVFNYVHYYKKCYTIINNNNFIDLKSLFS